jgi:hypothetical protein
VAGRTSTSACRFRARIEQQGPNPYVAVPERVSRAFAARARAGRINVVGKLEGVPFQATLIPARRGRHRLFVHGGMRSAAGVAVGDLVMLEVRAVAPDHVRVPPDMAAALRRVPGARAAFDRLPAAHRRGLVRLIDDSKSAATRTRRVETTVAHVRGGSRGKRAAAAAAEAPARELWTCPKCGNQFVTRNLWHSCRRYSLDDTFRGKPAAIRALFDRFRVLVERCGPVRLVAYRDKVAFMVRVRFCGASPRTRWLDVALWLTRRIADRRFLKVQTLAPDAHVHVLRIAEPADLDARVAAWLRESYAIGCQRHLAPHRRRRA